MKNITVTIPDDAYREARVWAAERGISLSKVVAYLLEHLPRHPAANRRFPAPRKGQPTDPRNLPPETRTTPSPLSKPGTVKL
jgi:hypothetical protein